MYNLYMQMLTYTFYSPYLLLRKKYQIQKSMIDKRNPQEQDKIKRFIANQQKRQIQPEVNSLAQKKEEIQNLKMSPFKIQMTKKKVPELKNELSSIQKAREKKIKDSNEQIQKVKYVMGVNTPGYYRNCLQSGKSRLMNINKDEVEWKQTIEKNKLMQINALKNQILDIAKSKKDGKRTTIVIEQQIKTIERSLELKNIQISKQKQRLEDDIRNWQRRIKQKQQPYQQKIKKIKAQFQKQNAVFQTKIKQIRQILHQIEHNLAKQKIIQKQQINQSRKKDESQYNKMYYNQKQRNSYSYKDSQNIKNLSTESSLQLLKYQPISNNSSSTKNVANKSISFQNSIPINSEVKRQLRSSSSSASLNNINKISQPVKVNARQEKQINPKKINQLEQVKEENKEQSFLREKSKKEIFLDQNKLIEENKQMKKIISQLKQKLEIADLNIENKLHQDKRKQEQFLKKELFYRKQIQNFKKSKEQYEEKQKIIKDQLELLKNQNKALKNTHQLERNSMQAEYKKNQEKVIQFEKEFIKNKAELVESRKIIDKLQKTIKDFEEEKPKMLKILEGNKGELHKAHETTKVISNQKDILNQKFKRAIQRVNQYERQTNKLNDQLTKLEKQIKQSKEQIQKMDDFNKKTQEKVHKYEDFQKKCVEDFKRLEHQKVELQKLIRIKEKQMEEVQRSGRQFYNILERMRKKDEQKEKEKDDYRMVYRMKDEE